MVAAPGDPERLERLQHTCRQSPVGSSAALALQSPQAPEGQSAWLRGELTPWQALLHPVHWDHQQCPAVSFPIAPLCTRLISGRELDTHRGHHTPSLMSVQDANRAGTYRQIVIHLPGLIFPTQNKSWRVPPGKGRAGSLGWSRAELSWSRPSGTDLQREAECV